MYQSLNLPLSAETRDSFGGWDGLRADCAALGVDGMEGIWAGEAIPEDFPSSLLTGYHLIFYADWVDFYREDHAALRRKFGSLEKAYAFFGGSSPEFLLEQFREDLARAERLGAKYVVFHVSDGSIEEAYTFRWLHTDEEVIDASADLLNRLLPGPHAPFELLLENQWWAGLTFTEPKKTARLLEAVRYPRTGIMLDTGHLMVTNPKIRTQKDGLHYIHSMRDRQGSLCSAIRGVNLHQSLSGPYLRKHTGGGVPPLPEDYIERFCVNYAHIQRIDRHRPWTNPAVAELVARIAPQYLTHELAALSRKTRLRLTGRQIQTLKKGGLTL